MRFINGKAIPTVEQDRNYVGSERYRLHFEDAGEVRCPGCLCIEIERRPNYAIDRQGLLRVACRCTTCTKQWQEVYSLCGCDQLPRTEPPLDWSHDTEMD